MEYVHNLGCFAARFMWSYSLGNLTLRTFASWIWIQKTFIIAHDTQMYGSSYLIFDHSLAWRWKFLVRSFVMTTRSHVCFYAVWVLTVLTVLTSLVVRLAVIGWTCVLRGGVQTLDRWWYATREQGELWLVLCFLHAYDGVHWRTAGMIWLFILAMNATTVNAGYSEAERDAMPAIIPQDSIVPRGVCTHETEAMCPILPFNKYRHQHHLLNII